MNPNIIFVVLALTVTANSNALSIFAANETSELAIVNIDTAHGEGGKRLLRTSNHKKGILDEERIGTPPTPELLEALRVVQEAVSSLVNPSMSVENMFSMLMRASPETKKIIDSSSIDIKQVLAKTQDLLDESVHSVDDWEIIFYKALGGEYFSRISHINFPDAPPTMNDPSRKNLKDMVAGATDYFKNVGVDPDGVMKKAFWLHDNVGTKLDNQKIFNMAYGGEYFVNNP